MRNPTLTLSCPLSNAGECDTVYTLSISPPDRGVGIMGYTIEEIYVACKCVNQGNEACQHVCDHMRMLWREMATTQDGPLEKKLYVAAEAEMYR